MESVSKKYIILSFDGGGVRMVLQYRILQRILEKFPTLLDRVSLFSGTSAGSILAAGLATNVIGVASILEPANELISKKNVKTIFESYGTCRKITSLGGLRLSKYTNDNLMKLLASYFGAIRMKDIDKCVFIPAFCINAKHAKGEIMEALPSWTKVRVNRWHPVYYTNFKDDGFSDKLIVDVILESSAAPTYFPIENFHIDGGIGNNNPCLSALTSVLRNGIDIKDIFILSFGSGESPTSFNVSKNESLGVMKWLPKIINMIFDADQEVVARNTYQILGDNFWRIQPVLETQIELDDTSKYEELIKIADKFDLTHTFEWLETLLYN
ncbi:MAG TPA: patatin-like phospholipase family protein [Saprospiraceae bacterium]|nr:patatin-like phospholipase family protein [Saprospiraceae bacterium]